MATETDIIEFYKGEYVEIDFFAKNRDGSVLSSPSTQTVAFTVAETQEADPLLSFSTVDKITLSDEATAKFTIGLLATDLTAMIEGRTYYYNIWVGTTQRTMQAKGKFVLQKSIEV